MVKVYAGVRRRIARVVAALVATYGGLALGTGTAFAAGGSGTKFSMPSFSPTQPPNTGSISTVMGWMTWGGLAVCVLGLIFAGAKMGIDHRRGGGGSDHASSVGYVLGGAILIGAASSVIGALG